MNSTTFFMNNLHYKENVTSVIREASVGSILPYTFIFIGSFFGNSVLIHIIRTDNSLNSTTNCLILYQAVADLLISLTRLIDIPLSANYFHKYLWIDNLFGIITCKLYLLLLIIPAIFSACLLVMIAVERFYAVTRPLQLSPMSRHLKRFIFGIWIWCSALATDIIAQGSLEKVGEHHYCGMRSWMVLITLTILNTGLCLLIIAPLYSIVCYKLWFRKVPGEGNSQSRSQTEAIKTAKRITLMMISIMLLYVIFWVIPDIVIAFHFWISPLPNGVYRPLVNSAVLFSFINPFFYFTFIQNFRSAFKGLFGNCLRRLNINRDLFIRSQSIELQRI